MILQHVNALMSLQMGVNGVIMDTVSSVSNRSDGMAGKHPKVNPNPINDYISPIGIYNH